MSGWVWFAEAYGPAGAVKFALTAQKEAGPDEIAFMRGQVSGMYHVAYGEWCETMRVTSAPVEHRTFRDLAEMYPIDPAQPTRRRTPHEHTRT